MAHKGTENLRVPTTEEAREIGRKGGLASVESRRRKKLFRETLSDLMLCNAVPADICAALEAAGMPIDIQSAIHLAAARKAMLGDVEAMRYIRDTMGQKPTEQYNLSVSDKPVRSMDLTMVSDSELQALAERAEGAPALPEPGEKL